MVLKEGDFMKKWINKQTIISFILGAILFSGVNVGAATLYQFALSTDILYINGAKVDKPLYIYQDSNHIPLRAGAETLGLDVAYNKGRIDLTSPRTDLETVSENVVSCVLIRVYDSTDESTRKLIGTASGVIVSDGIIVRRRDFLQ